MNKKIAIIVSIVLALIFTTLLVRSVNVKYADLKKNVDVVRVESFIPAGSEIRSDQVSLVKTPEVIATNMVQNLDEVIGKTSRVGLVEGQYIYTGTLESGVIKPNMIEISVPVDISSSDCVVSGDVVDVFLTDKGATVTQAPVIYHGARVLHSYDQNGSEVSPVESDVNQIVSAPGSKIPVSVALEVTKEAAPTIVQAASKKCIYLGKVSLE